MLITPSFKKSLIVEQFQGNYLKLQSNLRPSDSLYQIFSGDGFLIIFSYIFPNMPLSFKQFSHPAFDPDMAIFRLAFLPLVTYG